MKQFFEQYGGVALGILALLVLIAMITPVGNIIKTSLQGTVQTFSSGMNSQTDSMTNSMAEIIKEASTERHYDDAGNILNGIIDRTLYVDGVAYHNVWSPEENRNIAFRNTINGTITNIGYNLIATNCDPWIGDVSAPSYTSQYVNSQGQKYYIHENKDYIVISRNAWKNCVMYFDQNNYNLSPLYSNGAYNGYHGTVARITASQIPAGSSYFTLRIGNGDYAITGQTYEFEIMVFEIPSDLEVDLSSL